MAKYNINQPDIQDIILKYLENKLSSEENLAFKQSMMEDNKLKTEVEFTKTLKSTLSNIHLKSTLKKVTKEIKFEAASPKEIEDFEKEYLNDKPTKSFPAKKSNWKIIIGLGIFTIISMVLLFNITIQKQFLKKRLKRHMKFLKFR